MANTIDFLLSDYAFSISVDLLDATDKPSDPVDFVKLVEFANLPKEFQERVRINEGQSLYPPLNEATAGEYQF